MKDKREINDEEINRLLKQRLLEQEDDALLEAEAKYVFASQELVIPSTEKERELIKKLKRKKFDGKYFNGILTILATLTLVIIGVYSYSCFKGNLPVSQHTNKNAGGKKTIPALQKTKQSIPETPAAKPYPDEPVENYEYNYSDIRGQVVHVIEKENADCTTPILITDTVVTSLESPKGYGNELEFFDNAPDDVLYVEKEHHTVWYKFWARQDCDLSFDIIPVSKNDDYDFMLFKCPGGDFRSKVISKSLKPLRTCISRNDKSIDSRTGLSFEEPKELFIHSGVGVSYVKYISVKKGEPYYLMVDNVYPGGKGHRICFHYRCHGPDELYVGKKIALDSVYYVSDEYEFRAGSEPALKRLLVFMQKNPLIKVEVEGHVNTGSGASPVKYEKNLLSQLRAQAIKTFLVNNGILEERIDIIGYGDKRKVIKDPRTIKEYLMNMRSSILIVSMDYTKKRSL